MLSNETLVYFSSMLVTHMKEECLGCWHCVVVWEVAWLRTHVIIVFRFDLMLMFSLLQCYSSEQGSFHVFWLGTGFDPRAVVYLACIHGEEHIKYLSKIWNVNQQDIEDLDHYEMKEEEPVDGKKSEDDGIEKENLAILEKIRKNQRQDHLNVSLYSYMLRC